MGSQRGLALGHGQHGSGGDGLHETAPLGDERDRVFQGEDAGEVSGDVLSDAVADHGDRLEAP